MADFKVTRRETDSKQNKGQISTQAYLAQTVRKVDTVPSGGYETNEQVGTSTQVSTSTKGDVTETRTSTGISKSQTQSEDKGVTLTFRVMIQNRNPILRS
jgi:hypothetical protein